MDLDDLRREKIDSKPSSWKTKPEAPTSHGKHAATTAAQFFVAGAAAATIVHAQATTDPLLVGPETWGTIKKTKSPCKNCESHFYGHGAGPCQYRGDGENGHNPNTKQ